MKDNNLKWLALTLLLGVSVLCYALYTEFYPKNEAVPSAVSNIAEAEPTEPEVPDTSDGLHTEEPTVPTAPAVVYTEFPRAAAVQDGTLAQHIGGLGAETLLETYELGEAVYIIFLSASDSYDVHGGGLCVAKLDKDLSLQAVVVLDGEYLCSKPTAEGLFVCVGGDGGKIHLLNYDLTYVDALYFEDLSSARLYLTDNEILLFGLTAERVTVKIVSHNLELLRSASYPFAGGNELYEILPTAAGYGVVIRSADSFSVVNYNRNSGFSGDNMQFNCQLLQLLPYSADGATFYLTVTKAMDGILIAKRDAALNVLSSYLLDAADAAYCYPVGPNYAVITTGEKTKYYLFCSHLNFVLKMPTDEEISSIAAFRLLPDGVKLAAFSADGLKLIDLTATGTTLTTHYSAAPSAVVLSASAVYFSSAAKEPPFSDNFGETDIFIFKTND